MESKLTIEGLEKERDFYFTKLRDIEVLAQEHEADGGEFVQRALQVGLFIGGFYFTQVLLYLPHYSVFLQRDNDLSIAFYHLFSGTICDRRRICGAR